MINDKIIESYLRKLNVNNYSIREEIIDIAFLTKTASPYRRFINFNPDEIVIPYQYNMVSTLSAGSGVNTIDFALRSAINQQRITNRIFLNADLSTGATSSTFGQFNHISAHREFLTIEWFDDSSWIYTGTINVIIVKILSKHT